MKKITVESAADLEPKNTKVQRKSWIIIYRWGWFFDTKDLKKEDKKFILDLIEKADFCQEGNVDFKKVYDEEIKLTILKDETKDNLKIENFLLTKPEMSENKAEEKI